MSKKKKRNTRNPACSGTGRPAEKAPVTFHVFNARPDINVPAIVKALAHDSAGTVEPATPTGPVVAGENIHLIEGRWIQGGIDVTEAFESARTS